MYNAVFWDVTPRGSYKTRRFGGTYRLFYHQGARIGELRLLIIAKVVISSPILVTIMMEATMHSSETSGLTIS
jgi:hypothetical protein